MGDVAERAAVSPTTVSHVLSGNRPVRKATAARVRQAMKDLRYVPNRTAKSLRLGTTQTISLLVPDISNSYFAELAKGAEDAAESAGFNLVLCNTDFRVDRERRYFSVVRAGAFDGLIHVAGAARHLASELRELAESIPIVVADEEQEGVNAPVVVSDNFRGGLLAGEHLRDLGHRRALYIPGPEGLATTVLRQAGFESGFNGPESFVQTATYTDYREQHGYEAVAEAFGTAESLGFTAVFAGNDLMAVGALRALAELSIAVPEDVSVVGYDDIHLASLVRPSLTTIRQRVYGLGEVAAEQLILQIRSPDRERYERVVLDVDLVVRQSSARARSQST